jgi:hypothetical protein
VAAGGVTDLHICSGPAEKTTASSPQISGLFGGFSYDWGSGDMALPGLRERGLRWREQHPGLVLVDATPPAPRYRADFRDGSDNVTTLLLTNGVAASLPLRITSTAVNNSIKYTAIALPARFGAGPSANGGSGRLRRALEPLFEPGALDDPVAVAEALPHAGLAVLGPERRNLGLELLQLGGEHDVVALGERVVQLGAPLRGALDFELDVLLCPHIFVNGEGRRDIPARPGF